jgi:solute carrier family 45, member 1/2/4
MKLIILLHTFSTKIVYIGSQLIYSVSMILLALTKTKSSALILSPAAGIMYSTLFTVPYLLVAKYHQLNEQVNEKVNLINRIQE